VWGELAPVDPTVDPPVDPTVGEPPSGAAPQALNATLSSRPTAAPMVFPRLVWCNPPPPVSLFRAYPHILTWLD